MSEDKAMINFEQLEEEYLDWINNYFTVEDFANARHITTVEAAMLIEVGRSVNERLHKV